jgi:hypothetical protein
MLQTTGFVDSKTIGAFGTATAAVFAVTATIRKLSGIGTPWVPFLLSLGFSFALAYSSDALNGPLGWVIAIVNGCLLFSAVVGLNEGASARVAGRGEQQGAPPKKFFASFFYNPPEEGS